jgi:hypothetical protein
VLEMFALYCFRVRKKSGVNAIQKFHIKRDQLFECLIINESHTYFYVSRSTLSILHWVFTYLSVFCDVASKIS